MSEKSRPARTESFNEKALPPRKPLSTNRNSLRKENPVTSGGTTPPQYPEVVRGETEVMESRPGPPESSYHSDDLRSPQLAYNPPLSYSPQQQNYAEQGRYYIGAPSVAKHYESGAPTRFAWHKTRLLLRLLSIIVTLLPLFIVYGWYNEGRCANNNWGYYYGYYDANYCWRITSVTVVPVVVVLNLLELIVTGMNGRGTHPSAQLALDSIMGFGLVAAAIYDFKNLEVGWLRVVPALEVVSATIQFTCAACDAWAIRILSWSHGQRRSRFPW